MIMERSAEIVMNGDVLITAATRRPQRPRTTGASADTSATLIGPGQRGHVKGFEILNADALSRGRAENEFLSVNDAGRLTFHAASETAGGETSAGSRGASSRTDSDRSQPSGHTDRGGRTFGGDGSRNRSRSPLRRQRSGVATGLAGAVRFE